jgi:hypothetical protein
MATFVAFAHTDNVNNAALKDLDALKGTEGSVSGTGSNMTVTYTDSVNLPGVSLVLTGSNFTNPTTSAMNITGIEAFLNGQPIWDITGLTGINGAPLSATFNAGSIFQAEAFHNVERLLFHGNSNTIIGGSGLEGLFGFGIEGTQQTIFAGTGHDKISGNGGIDTVFAGNGHYDFEFDFLDKNNPLANTTTIYHYNAGKDHILLDRFVFSGLTGTPTLKPSELRFGHPVGGHEQIVYNQNNGHLYNDFFSTTLGHEVHELFAVLDTTGPGAHHPHHPALTASDFVIV